VVIDELLKMAVRILSDLEYSNPNLEARLLLSHLLDVDKTYTYAYGDKEVSIQVEDAYMSIVELRSKGYPLQYILKSTEFMGLDFYIEEGVLVPRPDTEVVVEYILNYLKNQDSKTLILDLGIGSGAISLSVANYCDECFVYGVDIGDIPIKIANINKKRFNLDNVDFLKGDLFNPIESIDLKNQFDIIVSNPPYIPDSDIEDLQIEVRKYEPRLALSGGIDGLDFYRRITKEAKKYLKSNGLLIYEIGYNQGEDVKAILFEEGYENIRVVKDLQGLDRVVTGHLIVR